MGAQWSLRSREVGLVMGIGEGSRRSGVIAPSSARSVGIGPTRESTLVVSLV